MVVKYADALRTVAMPLVFSFFFFSCSKSENTGEPIMTSNASEASPAAGNVSLLGPRTATARAAEMAATGISSIEEARSILDGLVGQFETAYQIDPKEGATDLRRVAKYVRAQRPSEDVAEQSRRETLTKHLFNCARQMELRAQDHESTQRVLSQIQSTMQMYMP